jgi:hypothetical protein
MLTGSLLALVAALFPRGAAHSRVLRLTRRTTVTVENVLSSIAAPASARHIGRLYLGQSDGQVSLTDLANWFAARNPVLTSQRLAAGRVCQVIAEMHLRDLHGHRLAIVDGWILSETEAKRTALYALAVAARGKRS